jgi:FKBP-type peptidyl-prolyl cis-trans isomerase (trigger factor)
MKTENKKYSSASIRKLDKSRVAIDATIAPEIWQANRPQAVKNIAETITVDGFRKGMVPENILITKVGDSVIVEETAEIAISKAYFDILVENKVDAISKPEVSVTKIAKDNPLEFTITTSVVPEVKLPDYKKLSKDEIVGHPKSVEVTDKDVEEAILKIRRSRVSHEDHDHEKLSKDEHDALIEKSMPEFNDKFVATLGDFKNVEEFKTKLREMILVQKNDENKEKLRLKIADALSDATTIEIPDVLIDTELARTQAQFEDDIERMGVKLEEYLKYAKKTIEDLKIEWRPHAEKKAKLQLILNAIASIEKISASPQEIEDEVSHILEHYKDADKERAAVYAETVLTNEKVFRFLSEN